MPPRQQAAEPGYRFAAFPSQNASHFVPPDRWHGAMHFSMVKFPSFWKRRSFEIALPKRRSPSCPSMLGWQRTPKSGALDIRIDRRTLASLPSSKNRTVRWTKNKLAYCAL
jgi:hypothetical protein